MSVRLALALVLTAVLSSAAVGCAGNRSHIVRAEVAFASAAMPESCPGPDPHGATEAPWRPVYSEFGREAVMLYPVDELWVIDLRDGYGEPMGDRRGFVASLRCHGSERQLQVLECPLDQGNRRLFVSVGAPTESGLLDDECVLELALEDGEQRWFVRQYALLLRRDLRLWIEAIGASAPRARHRSPRPGDEVGLIEGPSKVRDPRRAAQSMRAPAGSVQNPQRPRYTDGELSSRLRPVRFSARRGRRLRGGAEAGLLR